VVSPYKFTEFSYINSGGFPMLRKILIEREISFLKGYKLVGHISDTSIGDRSHHILIVNLINLHEKGRDKIKLTFQYDPGKNGTYWHSQKI
jgi:hypothetical protein